MKMCVTIDEKKRIEIREGGYLYSMSMFVKQNTQIKCKERKRSR
jgi:hypothetical protein